MTVTSVNTTTFLSDTMILIRDDLLANITDPIAATRPAAEKFVMTSYPSRPVRYPIITIKNPNFSTPEKLGMASTLHKLNIPIEIRIWAMDEKQKDELAQQVVNRLRNVQLTYYVPATLFDFQILSAVNVDENGIAGIKSKIIQTGWSFILGA